MKWLAILFSIFIMTVILLADLGAIPPAIKSLYDFPYGDKLGHFALYGLLALVMNLYVLLLLPQRQRIRVVWIIGLLIGIFIGVEELSQIYLSARTFDLVDLSASYAGVGFFSWISTRMGN